MPGGLLNIIASGNADIILTGNPTKTFFKTVYAKHTNFGIQKFRLDYNGTRDLDPNMESKYVFKIPRHAELPACCICCVWIRILYFQFQIFGVPFYLLLYQMIVGSHIILNG